MTLLIPHNKQLGLLSEAESTCFQIARRHQRRQLVVNLFSLKRLFWSPSFERLAWSGDVVRFLMQCLILLVYLPVNFVVELVKFLHGLLLFPIRFLLTFTNPAGLHAPGEKNLVGLYNAFFPFLDLDTERTQRCVEDWVPVLYGPDKAKRYRLGYYVEDERQKQKRAASQSGVMAASFRSFRAIARERLSKDLGYYSGARAD